MKIPNSREWFQEPTYNANTNIMDIIGKTHLNASKLDPKSIEAKKIYERAITIGEYYKPLSKDDASSLVKVLNNLGIIYARQGKSDKAKKLYNRSIKINQELASKFTMSTSDCLAANYTNLAILYEVQGKLEKAERTYNKVIALGNITNDGMPIEANAYGNMGCLYFARGNPEQAEEYFKIALKRGEAWKDTWDGSIGLRGKKYRMVSADQYGNLSALYKKQGKIGLYKYYGQKSLDLYQKMKDLDRIELVKRLLDDQ